MSRINYEKEFEKVNSRIDRVMSILEEQRKNECVSVACNSSNNIEHKTYELVKKMKYDNDMKIWQEKIQKVDEEIKKLEKEKLYMIDEKCGLERRYYEEI